MKTTLANPIKTLAACALVLLLCSCAGTSVKKTWKSPQYSAGPLTNLAVLVIEERGLVRQGFENRFVAQLKKNGTTAMTTFNLASLPEINQDKRAAAERFRAAGCQAVLAMRLASTASTFREVRPGPERYGAMVTGYDVVGWYDYYSVAYQEMSSTYGNLKTKVYLETALFDLGTGNRLWTGLSETAVTETMDRVAEMDPVVAKFVAAMRKDDMIP